MVAQKKNAKKKTVWLFFNQPPERIREIVPENELTPQTVVLIDYGEAYDCSKLPVTRVDLLAFLRERRYNNKCWLDTALAAPLPGGSLSERFLFRGTSAMALLEYTLLLGSFGHRKSAGLDFLLGLIDALHPYRNRPLRAFVHDPHKSVIAPIIRQLWKAPIRELRSDAHWPRQFPTIPIESRATLRLYLWARFLLRWWDGRWRKRPRPTKVLFSSHLRFARGEKNSFFGDVPSHFPAHTQFHFDNLRDFKERQLIKNLKGASYVGDFYTLNHLFSVRALDRAWRREWRQLQNDQSLHATFMYKGIHLFPFVRRRFDYVFSFYSLLSADQLLITQRILRVTRPSVVVLDHEYGRFGIAFLINARKEGIRSLALQYELIHPNCMHVHQNDKQVLDDGQAQWRPLPDVKCVWSSAAKNILTTHCNYPPAVVTVTGNQLFDKLFSTEKRKRGSGRKVLLAVHNDPHSYRLFLEAARLAPHITFIIKPHPKTSAAALQQLIPFQPKNVDVRPKTEDIYAIIKECDVVVTKHSTTGIEALALRTPIVILDIDSVRTLPYQESGAAMVSTPDALAKAIRSARFNSKMERFLQVQLRSGEATPRIVKAIDNLLRQAR